MVCEQLPLSFYKHVISYRSYMAFYKGIWTCDTLFGLHGILWVFMVMYMSFYNYVYEFISSWDSSSSDQN